MIGEAAGKVSQGFRAEHPDIPWREITGLRHRLIHGYDEVRLDIVWRVATEMAPQLISTLGALVPPETEADKD